MSTPSYPIEPIKPGSSLYYALLYCSTPMREAVAVLLSFFNEMNAVVNTVSEPSVAKAKLAWWSTEITQTYKHYPHHPLSFEIDKLLKQYQLPEAELQHFIQAKLMLIEGQDNSQQEIERYCRQDIGAKLYLISCITSKTLPNEEFIYHLGVALHSIDEIRRFGKTKQAQAEIAKVHYEKALASLKDTERYEQLSLLILAKLYMTLLAELERSGFDVVAGKRMSLTPIRKCWIAWRTKVYEKKRNDKLLYLK
ncbi:MAG: squalene/phytoene synthase family protein [Proteobacteria bacterium]|nr:squalene/phytoene synthase family protein [Pseudomonadota bacterium]